jgi:hypothetical protein
VEHLAGIGPSRKQRVVTEDPGVAVAGALLVVAFDLTDRRVDVEDETVLWPGPQCPRPSQGLRDHLVELTDMAKSKGPKEYAECGRCHHPVGKHGFGRPGTEHLDMVDVAGSRHDRVHEAQHLATGHCPTHTARQPQARVDQRLEAETNDECRDEQKSGVGDEVRLVECHLDPVETARYLSH